MDSSVPKFLVPESRLLPMWIPSWVSVRLVFYTLLGFGVYFLFKLSAKRIHDSKHIPGMKLRVWNVLGDTINLRRSEIANKMHPKTVYISELIGAYSQLFREKAVFCVWLAYSPFVVFIRAKEVEELISGTKMNQKGWSYGFLHSWLGTGLLTSHGSKWKTRRKLLTPSFHYDILKDFIPLINEQSQLLVEKLQKETQKPWTDIVEPITLCSLDIICETSLGASVKAQENTDSEYVKAVLRASYITTERAINPYLWLDFIFYTSRLGRQFKKDISVMHAFTRKVIKDKKSLLLSGNAETGEKKKRKALMDLLLDHHIFNHDISEEDIREEVDTFTFEGHDTTSMGMSWALYLIGLHQEVQEKIHEEIDLVFGEDKSRNVTDDDLRELKYLDCVLKESQRLYPSVPLFMRQATEDLTIGGYRIPKGATCTVSTYELHRDQKVFPNPEKFDPDRFLPENSLNRHPYAYIPFSAGPRNCIGQRFAMMEEKIVVANILRNFTLKSLQPRDLVQTAQELILRTSGPLKLKITSRNNDIAS